MSDPSSQASELFSLTNLTAAEMQQRLLTVVGSVNADIYIELGMKMSHSRI